MSMTAKYGLNVPKASAVKSAAYGSTHTPGQIMGVFDTIPNERVKMGIVRFVKPQESLLDHIVHQQDIRRPLGLPRHPEERFWPRWVLRRVSAALSARRSGPPIRLVATDVDWSHGEGPEVRGTGEAILLAITGRPVVLDELTGDGTYIRRACGGLAVNAEAPGGSRRRQPNQRSETQ